MKPEEIARVCHEANRAYSYTIGDYTHKSWEDSPQWVKDSAINGVEYHLMNKNSTPKNSHEQWLKNKKADGWKWGPKKDPVKKEHPCFLDYEDLPEDQRIKDSLFVSIIRALS